MTVYKSLHTMTKEQLAEWIETYGSADGTPWLDWWSENYCGKCDAVSAYVGYLNRDADCSYCEINKKCRFFPEKDRELADREIIMLWLDSEAGKNDK